MKFNKNWTKEDNDILRNMIKENKSVDDIRNFFGNDKLFYHPTKKYYHSNSSVLPRFNRIEDFNGFINEIKYDSLKTDFVKDFSDSENFLNEFDYKYTFQTNNGNRYIVDFIYLRDTIGIYKNRNIYNVSFTIENQRNKTEYEKETNLNEQHELIKRIIYIFKDFHNYYSNDSIYLIGETVNIKKINWYRDIIRNSFKNVIETEDISSFTNGLKAYYFEVVEI